MTAPAAFGYTVREVARLLELPVSRIRSFLAAGFLEPKRGERGEHRFTFQDLVVLRAARELAEADVPPRRIRRALSELAEQLPRGRSLAAVRISAHGGEVVVHDGGEAWKPESGQRLLGFEVADLAARAAPLAHRAAERAEAREGMSAEDWYGLGYELEATVLERAEEAYRRALELDPDHVDAQLNLGRLEHARGRLAAAERRFRRALELRPGDATAAFDLGVVYQDLGQPERAIAAYERAIRTDPGFSDAYFNLASLFESLGRPALAIQHLKRYRDLTRG